MPYVTSNGVIVNNLTMAQYKALRESGSIIVGETYVITDIDTYVDGLASASGGRSACMAALTSNKTVQSGDIKLPLVQQVLTGDDLSVTSNGIKCMKDGVIKASAFLTLEFANMSVPYVTIKKNTTNIAKAKLEECDPYIALNDILVNVSAGDIIYLYVESMQDRIIAQYANNGTRLTVEYL